MTLPHRQRPLSISGISLAGASPGDYQITADSGASLLALGVGSGRA